MTQVHEGAEKPARVLLIGYDPCQGMMIGAMLRAVWPRGLVVSHTERVTDAAQWLADHGATCVLLDLPPGEAPVAAVAQLSEATADAPIIVLADHPDEALGLAAVQAGAQDYLLKSELNAVVLGRAVRYAVERKRAEVALAIQAMHDPLTSLPNRALFLDRLRVALDRSRRTGDPVTVLFLDVDGFKQINDSLGHPAGDRLLTVLADRFRALMRPMDTVARFGGDEFTFLFEGLEGEGEASLVAQRITRSAAAPLTLGERQMSVQVSIGVTIISDPAVPVDDIIRHADTAMYKAKELGGARFEVFDHGNWERPDEAGAELERALGHAVERSELRVHYQPRVSLEGETELVGFEALLRWEHPTRGLMEPPEFIPIAEESGLILPIGDWVLAQALDQVRRWRRSRPEVTISVNLSPRQLADPGLVERLQATMRAGAHEPGVLCLEVSEGALAAQPQEAMRRLTALSEIGVQLAVDDFGTGHASAGSLRQLPLDILKIDRTLVAGLGEGAGLEGVSAAVALGHTLGCSVVAEGVETDLQLAVLRSLGCDGAQGYLFSEPMPEDGVHALLGAAAPSEPLH